MIQKQCTGLVENAIVSSNTIIIYRRMLLLLLINRKNEINICLENIVVSEFPYGVTDAIKYKYNYFFFLTVSL